VYLDVAPGEVLGVIGRNGAGKSTLLKILSRITSPTEGEARISGRIGSLLEVGTGFHPELTGRENIFLNGAILGMTRKETKAKFEEIIDFAEIDTYVDTPVKRYSSGMYVRLAFAVAAHLEPEVLVVDEVLAVGDLAFQRKCLGKMGDVARGGRTVLFVSHNMAAVQLLCTRACVLRDGELDFVGDVGEGVAHYVRAATEGAERWALADRTDRAGNGRLRFEDISFADAGGASIEIAQSGEDLTIRLGFTRTATSASQAVVRVAVSDMYGQRLFMCLSRASSDTLLKLPESGEIECRIPHLPLLPGRYSLSVWCKLDEQMADRVEDAHILEVIPGDFFGTGRLNVADGGSMLVENSWSIRVEDSQQ
jgi:lipopolysaccharide transport system ATP-binding protein